MTPQENKTEEKETSADAGTQPTLGISREETGRTFRKKPIVIEAVQWNGNDAEMESFIGNSVPWQTVKDDTELAIKTLEGVMIASPGDWIIKGVKGEFYPCKPDIFGATYESAPGSETLTAQSPTPPKAEGQEERDAFGGSPAHVHSIAHAETGDTL